MYEPTQKVISSPLWAQNPFLVSRACGPDLSMVLQVTSLGCIFHLLHLLQFGEPLVLENIVFCCLQSLLQPYCPMRLISEISINS